MTFSMDDTVQGRTDLEANLPEFKAHIDQQLADVDLSAQGFDHTNSSNARVIGAYGGVAPGLTWGGAEASVGWVPAPILPGNVFPMFPMMGEITHPAPR